MLQAVAMNDHRKLVAWQESMKLVEMVYTATRAFPRDEMFGLVAQMRRAAVSIPSNIAEGAGRNSSKELHQFLGIVSGSIAELETQIELAVRLNYLFADAECAQQLSRVGRLIVGLRSRSRTKPAQGLRMLSRGSRLAGHPLAVTPSRHPVTGQRSRVPPRTPCPVTSHQSLFTHPLHLPVTRHQSPVTHLAPRPVTSHRSPVTHL